MNGNDIFKGLKYVGDDLVEEAEFGRFPKRTAKTTYKRPFLAAALIALMLLLTGCAVVYMLKMQNLKVGEQEVTTPVFNEYMEFQGNETVPQQVLTIAGVKGSPDYQAAQEWFDFQQGYDPDNEIQNSVWGNYPEFPHDYDAYAPYSQEMVDKLDEIAAKYNLKLLGHEIDIHEGKRFCREMGIDSILMPDSGATFSITSATGYEGGSFYIYAFEMEMPDEEGQWPNRMLNSLYFSKKDCLNTTFITLDDTGDWQEWNYTTASGQTVLMLMSPSDYIGWIICDRGDSVISVRVPVRDDVGYNEDGKSWFESTNMTQRQFEMVADAIDFSMTPQYQGEVTGMTDGIDPTSKVQTQNGYTIEVKSVETDGYTARILLGITAPEGVALLNPKHDQYYLRNGNWRTGWITYDNGIELGTSSVSMDDNDGLANTHDFLLTAQPYFGEKYETPIKADSVWNLYFEDLVGYWWEPESVIPKEELLAEGVWNFDITFENGDFREIELIQEPVKAQAETGWSAKTGDVYNDVEITSFKLRSLSAIITHSGGDKGLTGGPGHQIFIVMKDGTQVEVFDYNGQSYRLMSPIDLDQVDHVLMPDGTKLPAPELSAG